MSWHPMRKKFSYIFFIIGTIVAIVLACFWVHFIWIQDWGGFGHRTWALCFLCLLFGPIAIIFALVKICHRLALRINPDFRL